MFCWLNLGEKKRQQEEKERKINDPKLNFCFLMYRKNESLGTKKNKIKKKN